ncbi:hypothetical protein [Microseira sp. BLCC-F43]|jgi:putative transposase|uniref:hypothetical protein n=1 Tax=Microseira sp. BLCC-F43 TaxID=3153602 RepID=UPI0035BB9C10
MQGLSLLTQSWEFEGIKVSNSQRLAQIEQVFTKPEYPWMKQYPSAIYSSAIRNLAKAIERWRQGDSGFPKFTSKASDMRPLSKFCVALSIIRYFVTLPAL